jgi:hypothetical protein
MKDASGIAAAVSAVIGLIYFIYGKVRASQGATKQEKLDALYLAMSKATTDQQRKDLQDEINKLLNSK